MKTLQGPLKGFTLVNQIHKIVFTPVNLPRVVILIFFLVVFVYRYFFGVFLFLQNHSFALHHTIIDVLGITQRVTSLKKSFYNKLSTTGSHFEVCSCIFESCFPSYQILWRCILYYSDSQCAKKNLTAYIPLLGALRGLFRVYASKSWET